jgi:hypothetical protein
MRHMADLIIPPGFAHVKVFWTHGVTGRTFSNGYGVDLDSALDQTDVDNLSAALAVSYKPVLSTGSLYGGVHIQEGNDGAPLVWDSTTGTGAGSRSGTSFATPQVQFLINKKTALGGRKFRGHTFISEVQEGDVGNDGIVLAATVTLLQTLANNVLSNLQAGDLNGMVVLHTDATVPTPVTSFVADGKASTLRARYRR